MTFYGTLRQVEEIRDKKPEDVGGGGGGERTGRGGGRERIIT